MRISPDTLAQLRTMIEPLDTTEQRDRYARRDIPRGELVKDIDKRYRWDLFYAAGSYRALTDETLTDTHIDTALRRIVPAL